MILNIWRAAKSKISEPEIFYVIFPLFKATSPLINIDRISVGSTHDNTPSLPRLPNKSAADHLPTTIARRLRRAEAELFLHPFSPALTVSVRMAVAHIGPMKLVLPVAYIAPMGLSASRTACSKGLFIGSPLTLVFLLSFPTPTNIIARFVKLCGLMPGK